MAQQIQKYLNSLGQEFNTESEADASDAFIAAEFTIEAYITFAGLKMAQAGLMRTHLAGWEAFMRRADLSELTEAAAVRVKAEKKAAADAVAAAKAVAAAAKATKA